MIWKSAASLLSCLAIAGPMSATASAQPAMTADQMQAATANWPESARSAAMDMMRKYGAPNQVTPHMMIWHANGPWKWTTVSAMEIPHNFPVPHGDVIEQAVNYNVPLDRYDDLATFDGSVMAERTKGELSARCGMEAANFLALNLAQEVATGRRSVQDARTYYARAMAAFRRDGTVDAYMQRLAFSPPDKAGDPDRAVR